MKFVGKTIVASLLLGVTSAASAMAPQAAAAPQIKVSAKAQPALLALQTAVNANDTAKIPGALAAARAAVQTKEDRFTLGQLQLKAALAAKDDAQVAVASDLILQSGLATPELNRALRTNQAQLRYKAKDYAGAVTALEGLVATDPGNTDALVLLGESYEGQGNGQQAVASFQRAIAAKKAAGQPVPPEWQKRAVAIAYTRKLPNLTAVTMDWVRSSPTPDNIRDAARIVGDSANLSDADQIDLFRLQRAAGALKGESDYYRYANTALTKGFPGEAKAVLDEGFASAAINRDRPVFRDVYTTASAKVTADRASLGATERSGLAATTARQAVLAGDVFLGYGDYAKAAALYRAALGKTGADASLINLRLGEALARSGDKAGAQAAFAAVTGPQQATAQLWQAWTASR